MIRRPEELTESIKNAVNHKAVLFSHILLAAVVASHTAFDSSSTRVEVILGYAFGIVLIGLILMRVFDMTNINSRPLLYIIIYQIMGLVGISLLSSASTPYVAGIFLVVFISNLYYGSKGVWATVAVFGLTTVIKYFYLSDASTSDRLNIVFSFFIFLGVCSLYVNYQRVFDWDRAKLKEKEVELINSINSLSLGFIITNSKPEITVINEASHQLLCGSTEHSASACKNVNLAKLLDVYGENSGLEKALVETLESREPRTIKSTEYNNKNWRLFVSPMLDNNKITGAAIVIQDITEEIILNRSRDEFFSIASHELRTPLTVMHGDASMIQDMYASLLKKDSVLRNMVNDIHDSSDRLITIVGDFLDVSSLEQGHVTYKLEPVSITKLMEKIVHDMSSSAEDKKIYLKLGKGFDKKQESLKLFLDERRTVQAIYNVVGNAIGATDKGGVTIELTNLDDENVELSIADTGRGIEPKMQPLLFRKFQQAGESIITRDETTGTGLELYIARMLTVAMGGTLELAHSEPGKGTVFVFKLPIATPEKLKELESETLT